MFVSHYVRGLRVDTIVPKKADVVEKLDTHSQALWRLKKMKQRWSGKLPEAADSLSETIGMKLSSERSRALRGAVHWFASHESNEFSDTVGQMLGGQDNVWRPNGDRWRMSHDLGYRHKTNVPHEFDELDRAQLEAWLKAADSMDTECKDLVDLHDTMQLRRFADYKSYEQTCLQDFDPNADAAINDHDCAPPERPKVREKILAEIGELDIAQPFPQPIEDEPKLIIRLADDAIAQEAVAMVNSIANACKV
jgi:hypothetical protein